MKGSTQEVDADDELHGATVYDADTLKVVATNFIVYEDGTHASVGQKTSGSDVALFHGRDVEAVREQIQERGWWIVTDDDAGIDKPFTTDHDELNARIDEGAYTDLYWKDY